MAFKGMLRRSLLFTRQLHVISRSSCNIKPASPTPSNLKRYNIPLDDRRIPNFYSPLIFFYSNTNSDCIRKPNASDLLKKYLSETLSKYYPFAGRMSCCGSYVDCNDEGVHFVDAQIDCNMSEALERAPVKEEDGLGHLFPPCTIWNQMSERHSGTIMYVQLNHFACGGIALAFSLSHHLADALTCCTFLRYWATLSLHSGDHKKLLHICPHLVHALLPPCDMNSIETVTDKNWTTKELVFPNTKLAELKAAVINEDKLDGVLVENKQYSRNELLTALLYRCLLAAADASNTGVHRGSVLVRIVNVRPMLDPPLPETSVGNFLCLNQIKATTQVDRKYRNLVAEMRKEKGKLKGIKSMEEHEAQTEFLDQHTQKKNRFCVITSMCNFPLYDVMDFGWGKPIKAAIVDTVAADVITLMDTADNDGIRAVVGLEEQEMKEFLVQKELLAYATL